MSDFQKTQCSSRSGFWVLKISRKIGVLKQSQPALFASITQITILFVFTCVIDVRYQTILAFVTSFGPFRNRSCKFVHWPENIRSSNACQVQAFSEQFERIFLTILLHFSILPLWNDVYQCLELILCRVVESSCLPTRIIVPHISWHDLPCHKTTKSYEAFASMVVSQFSPRKFVIQTWFYNCQQYLWLFHIVFEYIPGFHDVGKMLVLPNQLLHWVLSTSDQCFVSFQPIWCHPHTQIRITLCHGVRIRILNWKPSPIRVLRPFSNCLSNNSPAKGWPYRFRSRGTTESSILDHDLGHLCRGRRIQMSGHSDFGFFNNFGASSILTWV